MPENNNATNYLQMQTIYGNVIFMSTKQSQMLTNGFRKNVLCNVLQQEGDIVLRVL